MTEEILEFLPRKASLDMFLIYLGGITDVWKSASDMKNMWEKLCRLFQDYRATESTQGSGIILQSQIIKLN